ncbi:MAG: Rpn family recombination-promoting nuclease/putative transposase [Nitrospirae bacterium]|nr:Rpn family recombination-promoting nuclease/putative transposase [Nitrospirota bacterium]
MDAPRGAESYDKVLKELIADIERPLIEKVLGIKVDTITRLNVLTQLTDEREADFLFKVRKGKKKFFIIHAEAQSTNDPTMLKRMMRYFVHIYTLHEVIIKQYVIFIGKGAMRMKNKLKAPDVSYRYELIDMKKIACESFLYSGVPQEIVVSMLCNMGKRNKRFFAREILTELIKSVPGGLNLSKYIRQIEIFSRQKDMQKIVIEETEKMPIVYDLETDIRFIQGKENGRTEGRAEGRTEGRLEGRTEGRLEGMQNMIETLLKTRFGEKSLSLMGKIRSCEDESRLYAIAEALMKTDDISLIESVL